MNKFKKGAWSRHLTKTLSKTIEKTKQKETKKAVNQIAIANAIFKLPHVIPTVNGTPFFWRLSFSWTKLRIVRPVSQKAAAWPPLIYIVRTFS